MDLFLLPVDRNIQMRHWVCPGEKTRLGAEYDKRGGLRYGTRKKERAKKRACGCLSDIGSFSCGSVRFIPEIRRGKRDKSGSFKGESQGAFAGGYRRRDTGAKYRNRFGGGSGCCGSGGHGTGVSENFKSFGRGVCLRRDGAGRAFGAAVLCGGNK